MQHIADSDALMPPDEAALFARRAGEVEPPDGPVPRPGAAAEGAAAEGAPDRMALTRDLARLLVEPGDRDALLRRAVQLATQLVPAAGAWRLYVADPASPNWLTPLIERGPAGRGAAPGRRAGTGDGAGATLGLGEALDRQVLERHQVALLRPQGARAAGDQRRAPSRCGGAALPLMDASGALRGALVAVAAPHAALSRADLVALELVAYHLSALLVQRAPEAGAGPAMAAAGGQADERMAFISLAAHELRSPLTSVKGYAQLMLRASRRDGGVPASSMRALETIAYQASRMSDMVAELLDAARIQRGAFHPLPSPPATDLDGSVRRAVDQRRPWLEHHELRLEVEGAPLVGNWEAARVEQVVRDLLDNAIRYSPDGGVVALHVSRVGDAARVCVRDEGIGVAAEERERLYEAFFRGAVARARNLSGLGLGLFVSRAIVEGLGGRLWQEADDGRPGSEFCFELPLARDA